MPSEVGDAIDKVVDIFTFSIGAGSGGSCQLLNGYDLIGAFDTFKPTFKKLNLELDLSQNASVVIAGKLNGDAITNCFNGKIEQPEIYIGSNSFASWDFSRNMSSMIVPGNDCPNLKLMNAPTRAVTGAFWDASEMNWQHKPEHYASIAFHEDDIYDFNWEPDFSFVIPSNMPSGIYIMRISCGDDYDAMPFFVCPEKDKPHAKVCVLVSTFTYAIYGNHARPDYDDTWLKKIADWNAYPHNPAQFQNYGLSTYNYHSDGSGICHASHKRPLFNLRPGYLTFGQANCSGLRHFQADSHLISWLHAKGIEYEIITDETCNQCGDRVQIIRNLSELDRRKCKDCNDYFYIETVDWSTHSFTIVDNELVRDRYYYQCPSHYGKQDPDMMFL